MKPIREQKQIGCPRGSTVGAHRDGFYVDMTIFLNGKLVDACVDAKAVEHLEKTFPRIRRILGAIFVVGNDL